MRRHAVVFALLGAAVAILSPADAAVNIMTYGTPANLTCPPTGQYFVAADTTFGGKHISSNATSITVQVPFSSDLIPVEKLYTQEKKPVNDKPVCDKFGRCINAYEIHAQPINVDLGFRGPNNEVLLTQMLGYDGQVPGPTIYADMGVQSLVRMYNDINCSTAKPVSNATAFPTSSYYWTYNFGPNSFRMTWKNFGLTTHLHGAPSLAPFDGWADDPIYSCQVKDYVYPNDGQVPIWYHDHIDMFTEQTVEHGLFAGYYTKGCRKGDTPPQLEALGKPQYMFLHDHLFFNQPTQFPGKMNTFLRFAISSWAGPGAHGAFGDHNFVNGKIWPNVQVERKAYRWIFVNGASYRLFNLQLQDENFQSLMGRGFFTVVGSEQGLRQQPIAVGGTLLISPGERYEVVVDFSQFKPGTTLYLNNPVTADSIEPNPMFCYSHLIMKITVGGKAEDPAPPSFESTYQMPHAIKPTTLDHLFKQKQIEELCAAGLNGKADRRIQTTGTRKGAPGPFMFAEMTTSAWNASFVDGTIFPPAGPGIKKYLPTSIPANGYEIWEMYNNVTDTMAFQGNINHPMHMHLVDLIVCGRRNAVRPQSIKPYELLSPKDTFLLAPNDNVVVLLRFGPHIGSYMFHCHNLGHEDIGLMAAFNVSDVRDVRTPTKFPSYAYGKGHYEVKFANLTVSPMKWNKPDPLYKQDNTSYIARDLFFPDSLPATAMRMAPLNEATLKAVLERNYYEPFYPMRKNLATAKKGYKWAVMCDKKK